MSVNLKLFFWGSLVVLGLFSTICLAQDVISIRGKVVNAETKKPLPFVNVYFNNTYFGAVTDSSGNYKISNVPVEYKELVASFIGFKTARKILQLVPRKNVVVNFELTPDVVQLIGIVVTAKGPSRLQKEQLEFFKEIFIGTTPNAEQTEIVDPTVLHFRYEGEDLVAEARKPIEIENLALGYRLYVSLQRFAAAKTKDGVNYTIQMTTRFDTLVSVNKRERMRWNLNRIKTYNGSLRHFLVAMLKGKATEEGFRIYDGKLGYNAYRTRSVLAPQMLTVIPEKAIKPDTLEEKIKIFSRGLYQVNYLKKILPGRQRLLYNYPFPVSFLFVGGPSLTVSHQGEPFTSSDFWSVGYFDSFRLADQLPIDFDPAQSGRDLVLGPLRETSAIQGIVQDERGNPLAGAEVFINEGTTHTTTNVWGQFEIPNLYPGHYPMGFAYNGKKEILQTVDLSADKDAYVSVQLRDRALTKIVADDSAEYHTYLFQQLLVQRRLLFLNGEIKNPYVLQFKARHDTLDITASTPIEIEHTKLGYRWKYYLDHAEITMYKGKYHLQTSGLIKMDTLPSHREVQKYHHLMNRFDEYSGSINNFVYSLMEGRAKDEGFRTFILSKSFKKKPRFEKILDIELKEIEPDSLLVGDNGKFYLKIPKGLEIHYDYRKGTQRFYRGYSKQILRLQSFADRVAVTRLGLVDMQNLVITGDRDENLTRLPVDYKPPFKEFSDEKELMLIKSSNLQLAKAQFEKTYVQTDKPYYYPGDTIWLKAYMKYADPKLRDSLSRILYIDLIGPDDKSFDTRILKIEDGQAWGDIILPYNIPKGDYAIRAYTQWMRNFNEVYSRPLPILDLNSFLEPQGTVDTTSFSSDRVRVTIGGEKAQYHPREKIELNVQLEENDVPASANLSISVTDQSAVVELFNAGTIRSLSEPFKANGEKLLRIKYPVERAITFSGKIHKNYLITSSVPVGKEHSGRMTPLKPEVDDYSITTLLLNKNISNTSRIRGRDFKLFFDFTDTTTALIKAIDKNNAAVGMKIAEFDSLKNFVMPPPLQYRLLDSATHRSTTYRNPTHVLKEVVIRAKRIEPYVPKIWTTTQVRWGVPDYLYEGYALEGLRTNKEWAVLLEFLRNKVPDFAKTAYLIGITIPGQSPPITSLFPDAPGTFAIQPYVIYLNGSPISYGDIYNVRAQRISRVEVYNNRLDMNSNFVRVVSIFTEPYVPHIEQNYRYKLRGFDVPLSFRIPPLTKPDYRSTIYWNPNLKTDEQGRASISFPATDVESNYKITIEGMTRSGAFFRKVMKIRVRPI